MFKRNSSCAIVAALLLAATAAFSHADATGTDTAVAYQVNIAHDGIQTDVTLAPPYTKAWQVTLPGAVSYPIIAQSLVIVTADDATNIPTLYAFNQLNGQLVWSQPLPYPQPFSYPWANAAYDNGKVFAVGSAGIMSAFDAASGSALWSVQLPNEYLFSSPPTAAGGVVYTNGAGSAGLLYAVDEADGAVLAQAFVQNGDHSAPALSSNATFSSFACNNDFAFTLNTLSRLWFVQYGCEGGGGRTSVYSNTRVLTRDWASTGNLILDAATGDLLGNYGPAGSFAYVTAPAVSGNAVYFTTGGSVTSQDISLPSSPTTRWTFAGDGNLVTAPLLINSFGGSFVIAGSSTGTLYALDAATGVQLWAGFLGTAISAPDEQNISAPLTGIAAGQGLLVVPAGNTLVAFTGTGAPVLPTTKGQCMHNGWKTYGFQSQGDCIKYVNGL